MKDSKVAIAIVAEQLAGEGIPREDWDEIIYDELKNTPFYATPGYIKQLLSHYSGVRSQLSVGVQNRDSRQ